MSKRTVTTCTRRLMRAAGVNTPKARPGERTEAEKAVSRAQRKATPKVDSAREAEARVWAMAFGGEPEPVVAAQPVPPVTAPKAHSHTITAMPARKAKPVAPVAVTQPEAVSDLGTLEAGVTLLTWHKLNRTPVTVVYAGHDKRGRLLVKGVGTPLTAIPAWLLTRQGA